ncbi:MAG: DinB family protein [Caldilineaceae bacterium]
MNITWRAIIWQQFGAAIDMLDNALCACPEQRWRDRIWHDPTDAPEYTEFWFIVYHSLFWLDRYLSGAREGFAPPAPFIVGALPANPYTKEELQAYLAHCRRKCQATFETLTDEKANQPCTFPWGEEVSFAELQLYNMRHVQEHAAQLSLYLGQTLGSAPDWVARADHKGD